MNHDDIFAVIKRHLIEIVPSIDSTKVKLDASMKDLGANSLDRSDVVIESMEELGIKVPITELASVKNIGDLVEVFSRHVNQDSMK